ncbi:hypothetical protein HDE_05378 [Halotydeus destructor]|nr:hypothetical protein HDE_05378 [Halotydeus destructor]
MAAHNLHVTWFEGDYYAVFNRKSGLLLGYAAPQSGAFLVHKGEHSAIEMPLPILSLELYTTSNVNNLKFVSTCYCEKQSANCSAFVKREEKPDKLLPLPRARKYEDWKALILKKANEDKLSNQSNNSSQALS